MWWFSAVQRRGAASPARWRRSARRSRSVWRQSWGPRNRAAPPASRCAPGGWTPKECRRCCAGSVVLADAARAAAYLADRPGRVLLATGAKELPAFAALDPARLYPRVLPTLAGIAACEAAGIPHRNILAMQGPFTKELNAALLHQFHIDYMVTKDGGAAGGFAEKAEAAARCGVQLIVLRRPDDAGEATDTILQRCRELL